ncbi:hypothetical protein [Listeria sp. PSOL-1]|uniref:hypothetical protein n=1 Tax=Listeria sp. PSOL-1 TaxID=1844999 RepID=UPI0013D615AC|nr:hypothetical protein [Listeria sp. PSOL-1]
MAHQLPTLNFSGIKIAIDTLIPGVYSHIQNLKEKIGLYKSTEESEIIASAIVVFETADSFQASFSPTTNKLTISGPFQSGKLTTSMYYACEYLAESLLTCENHSVLIHGAAIYSDQMKAAQLILGEKGAGKTSLTLTLCKQKGYQLIGNDVVRLRLIDSNLYTEGGSDWFLVRKTAVHSSECLSFLKPAFEASSKKQLDEWDIKKRITPSEIGIGTFQTLAPLKKCVYIRIDHHQSHVYQNLWENEQKQLILFENIGRRMNNQTTPFLDHNGYFWGDLPLIKNDENRKVRNEIMAAFDKMPIQKMFANSCEALASL